MQTRKLLMITAVAAAIIAFTSFYLRDDNSANVAVPPSAGQATADRTTGQQTGETSATDAGGFDRTRPPEGVDPAVYHEEERQRLLRADILQRLQQAQDNPGNLQTFFNDLNRLCNQQGLDSEQCQAMLADALAEHPDPEFAAMVQRIRERMPAYEAQMQQTVMSRDAMSARERYDVIHEQRQQLLGVEETELMFGQERALADFRFAYGDLVSGAAQNMTTQERLAAIDELRQEAFGEHASALREEEGVHGAYRHDLDLLLTGVDDPAQRADITRQLRESYFDPETVERMEQRDEQVAEQQEQISSYQQAEAALDAEFEARREVMAEQQWQEAYQQALRELRLEYFSD